MSLRVPPLFWWTTPPPPGASPVARASGGVGTRGQNTGRSVLTPYDDPGRSSPRFSRKEYCTRCTRGAWGDFVDVPTCSTVKCTCFQSCDRVVPSHVLHCVPLTASHVSFVASYGITVTYTRSDGDMLPATVISASECGQCVGIKSPRNQGTGKGTCDMGRKFFSCRIHFFSYPPPLRGGSPPKKNIPPGIKKILLPPPPCQGMTFSP